MDANKVLRRYAAGERDFRLEDLKGISLIKANLRGVDLTGANLSNSDLSDSDLSNANLNWVSLRGAKMPDGGMHNDYSNSANYFG
jgi:uncharacterized protein YjbI with pentapeptide repeats